MQSTTITEKETNQTPYNVAILMATFNGEKYIEQQIASIRKNISSDIFIGDDGSTDRTISVINNMQDPKLTFVKKAPSGGAAQNFLHLIRTTKLSSYDYVAFSDQDDIWQPDKLRVSIDAMKRNKSDGFSSDVRAVWKDGRSRYIQKSQPQTEYDYFFESAGPGCTYVLSKRLFESLQAFVTQHEDDLSEIYAHDWLIYAFARHRGFSWIIYPNSTMEYLQHGNNVSGVNFGLKAYIRRIKNFTSGWYQTDLVTISNLFASSNKVISKVVLDETGGSLSVILKNFKKFRRKPIEKYLFALALFGRWVMKKCP